MTTNQRRKRSLPRVRIKKIARADDVGYRRPPRAHRFKAGQSGNPKGRPKGAKSTDTILRNILDRKIEIRVGGILRKISIREAILTRFTEDALKGNPKTATFLLNRYDTLNSNEAPDGTINEDDQDIIDAFARRLLQTQRKGKS
jgi:Family of unknown function (DUF5681)